MKSRVSDIAFDVLKYTLFLYIPVIRERVLAGMSRAAASGTRSGKPIGRPRLAPETEANIRTALERGDMGMRKVAVQFGGGDRDGPAHCPVLGGTGVARHESVKLYDPQFAQRSRTDRYRRHAI
jgi:hypothetical protein